MSIKLLSLNVEQDKHLATVGTFVEQEKADVVALMEVCEDNLDSLLPEYPHRIFAPNFHMDGRVVGVVIATKEPMADGKIFYADSREGSEVPPHGMGTHRPVMVQAIIEQENERIVLGAVHFTWTPKMSETEQQHEDLTRLLQHLDGELVLCGDFNIPRGNGAYKRLSARYKDNIPAEVITTIDPLLHRVNLAKNPPCATLQVVVDYVWSTPRYQVGKVRVIEGVSDHCGLITSIGVY